MMPMESPIGQELIHPAKPALAPTSVKAKLLNLLNRTLPNG
jgi:hypothetical protein